ncbi:MAG: FAD-dependent oxidoreductase [Campylobacterales bacterium]|nr:FAD-dependent oxidoreductase [Campylobacterales bacterium]
MKHHYDTIVIGAGIAGCSTAYFLKQKNQKVLLVDKNGIASGGSGAAGAFFSPKVGINLPIKQLSDEAFLFAHDLYKKHFNGHFFQSGILRIPKDAKDAQKFEIYRRYITLKHEIYTPQMLKELGIQSDFEAILFPQAGICNPSICEQMAQGIELDLSDIKELYQENGFWICGKHSAKNIVLATGYETDLLDIRYMSIKGIWGNRGDFKTDLKLDFSMHKNISISANFDGVIKIGATHELDVEEAIPCDDKSVTGLLEKASSLIDSSDFELIGTHCGMRASNRDYMPVVGKIIDVEYMLQNSPNILDGRKYPLKYIPNIYVHNALGARGFVFALYCANELANHIATDKAIDARLDPDRLFYNWIRKAKYI